MANISLVRGFIPIRDNFNGVMTGGCNWYYKGTTAGILAVGDPVIRLANSSDPNNGPEIVRATTGGAITGIIVGFGINNSNLEKAGYLLAADTGYVQVCDDPFMWYEVQEGGSGTALAITNIGNTINSVTAINGNTTIGVSNYQIDNASASSSNGNTFRLERLKNSPDNAVGQYAKWIVSINLSTELGASSAIKTAVA